MTSTPDWRHVLGHYPTGVTIITSVTDSGAPVGMIVGTFSSVSQDPPLIGFLPQRTSRTFEHIERSGLFRASVLGANHERFCRDFFTALPEERFVGDRWEFNQDGLPRVRDSVVWFDAKVHDILPAGDHVMVLGEVTDLGLGPSSDDVPLVFHRGGYGKFASPLSGVEFSEFGGKMRMAHNSVDLLQQLSMELGVQSSLATVADGEVVALTSDEAGSPYVGTSFPFAAPLDPGYAAWSSPAERAEWNLRGKGLIEGFDEKLADDILDLTRSRGYAISFGYTLNEEFQRKLSTPEGARTAFEGLWTSTVDAFDAYRHNQEPHTLASAVQLPIFGRDGQVLLELLIGSFDAKTNPERFRWIVETGADYARRITEAVGGIQPAEYAIRWS